MGAKQSIFDIKLKAKEWQWQLKTEMKHLDKEIQKIQADENKLRKEINAQAEKGNVETVQMLAKQIVRSRKAVQRLEKTKVTMHGVCLQLTTSIATMSTSASLKLSADVMRSMNAIAGVPETSKIMEQMRAEMAKCSDAEDSMEAAMRVDGEEEAAADEVQKVLEEMALSKMGPVSIAAAAAPVAAPAAAQAAPQAPQRQLVAAGGGLEPAPRRPPPAQPQQQQPPPAAPAGYGYGDYGGGSGGFAGYPAAAGSCAAAAAAPRGPSPQTADDEELFLRLQLLKA